MLNPKHIIRLFTAHMLEAINGSIAQMVVRDESVSVLLKASVAPGFVSERGVRKAITTMDFISPEWGGVSVEDLDVKTYRVRTPFGGVAVHTTAVVMLSDEDNEVLPVKVTLSSEFAGFEVRAG